MPADYLPRFADEAITGLLRDLPGLLLVGPRAAGKTTTAARHAASVVHLDRRNSAEAFLADPDVALARLTEPVLLDEWQAVPGVLGAVKRAVDSSPRPGRFIVTGSVRDDLMSDSWPITGRLVRLEMSGLSVREQARGDLATEPFLRRVADHGVDALTSPPDPPDLAGYVDLAIQGGFPEVVLRVPAPRRREWMLSYLDRLLTRDVAAIDVPRDPERLLRYFEACVINTAGEATDQTMYEAAGINRRTAEVYERLLTTLLLIEKLPAWSTDRLKRLVRTPKRYVRDPGLVASVLRAGADDVFASGDVLGRMIDTFVLSQLRAERPLYDHPPQLFHLRQEGGAREVDIVAELSFRKIVGLEIKASSAPNTHDARHLVWLRDQLGETFSGGVVLHTGPYAYPLADRIVAAPIACIWS
jgi:uncharacterized protein